MALRFHPAAFFTAHPREAGTKQLPFHSSSPYCRIFVPRRTCLLRARSSNGLPQMDASFGSSNELVPAKVLDGRLAGDGPLEPGGSTVSITIVGASGDLAKKKIFPALFALFYENCLPEHFTVFGYARTKMSDEELRNMISMTLTCRIDKRENCGDKMEQFLQRCFYHSGQYNSEEGFAELDRKLKEKEEGRLPNRLFYLSIPPNIFVDVVRSASRSASSSTGWTRFIVEKPFGRDSESSGQLTRSLKKYLAEEQIFRIDHYLGKELVENLSVLRFSNLVFEPLWSRNYIRNVQFIFSEDFGTEGRGGYFDNYGIIRDIMQNHLLQILALFAMETPMSLDAEDIRNEKVKVLRSMRKLKLEDVVVGQYKGHTRGGKSFPGYADDPTVTKGSITPTFAAAALFIDNARWDGVPFLMKAGKALHTRRSVVALDPIHHGGDPGAVPACAGQPVPPEHRYGPGQGDERAGAPGAARRGDLPQDQQQGARAGHAARPQQPQPALLRAVPPRDPGRLRAPAAGRHRGRATALHPERRARRGLGHLHARAQGAGGQEGGARALPVREQGARRRALPRCELQRQVGRHHQRRRILLGKVPSIRDVVQLYGH